MHNVFSYHPETKEFIGISHAQESPLEKGVILMPANSTAIQPPAIGEKQAAVWNGNGWWDVVADFRETLYYDTDGNDYTQKELGNLPEWALLEKPVIPEPPEPVKDTSAFDAACEQFKTVCGQIGTAIGDADFKGGFDEYAAFIQSSFAQANPGPAALLASMWSGANEYAKYEGAKLGYGQPAWWYKCWNIEREV